ncbi:MAG TPA: FoF1 ATP synthase subunit gamma [Xanthomonadales bacterium]
MTRRRNLERHRHSLAEIRDIMNSMKTLAYTETRKLARFIGSQHDVVHSIENVAMDLLSFYPGILPEAQVSTPVYLLVGTQRGFCGNFNHTLLKQLDSVQQEHDHTPPLLVAIGRKLCTLIDADERVAVQLEGANVAEEVTAVLGTVVSQLQSLHKGEHLISVTALFHSEEDAIVTQQLLPPFTHCPPRSPPHAYPPVLNETPQDFLGGLTDQYLLAVLHEILYTSLMAENQQRVAHLEGAVSHLDEVSADLARQCNTLRQGEIIEEIEVILLNSADLGGNPQETQNAGKSQYMSDFFQ